MSLGAVVSGIPAISGCLKAENGNAREIRPELHRHRTGPGRKWLHHFSIHSKKHYVCPCTTGKKLKYCRQTRNLADSWSSIYGKACLQNNLDCLLGMSCPQQISLHIALMGKLWSAKHQSQIKSQNLQILVLCVGNADAGWYRLVCCPWENSMVPCYDGITGSPVRGLSTEYACGEHVGIHPMGFSLTGFSQSTQSSQDSHVCSDTLPPPLSPTRGSPHYIR